MKKVFLFFGIAAFSSVSAQQKDVFNMNRHIRQFLDKNKNSREVKRSSGPNNYFNCFKSPYILPQGDKVFLLPQDNMPCVVPDMKQFTNMPNISNPNEYFKSLPFNQHLPGSIPNAVVPYRLIISE